MERATEIAVCASPLRSLVGELKRPEPSSPADQLTEWMMSMVLFGGANALLEAKETMDIRQRVGELLPDELDEGFPDDLEKEFWETLEKIALAWNRGLRDQVAKKASERGFSIEWFKWGHSSGFPVLVVKLKPTPEPKMAWDIADDLRELIDNHLGTNTACLIHP